VIAAADRHARGVIAAWLLAQRPFKMGTVFLACEESAQPPFIAGFTREKAGHTALTRVSPED